MHLYPNNALIKNRYHAVAKLYVCTFSRNINRVFAHAQRVQCSLFMQYNLHKRMKQVIISDLAADWQTRRGYTCTLYSATYLSIYVYINVIV